MTQKIPNIRLRAWRDAEDLGFIPQHRRTERLPIAGSVVPRDALQAEAEAFDTLELTRLAEVSDIGAGTIEALNETAELLCRAYPTTPAGRPVHPGSAS